MFDREIVMDSLRKIRMAIETILERSAVVSDPNELLTSPGGMMRLDAICMNLIAWERGASRPQTQMPSRLNCRLMK